MNEILDNISIRPCLWAVAVGLIMKNNEENSIMLVIAVTLLTYLIAETMQNRKNRKPEINGNGDEQDEA